MICTLSEISITTEEKVPMMTIIAAYALQIEDKGGSLAAGKFAELTKSQGRELLYRKGA